jgi:hypothetical protein
VSTAVVPFEQMERMGEAIAKSNLFGVKTVDQAVALMVIAQAEGRHPGSVANDYHIIQGRPALKADTMLTRFLAAGGSVKWTSYTSTKVAAIFSHPQGGSIEVDWTIEMAKSAGLSVKDNWKAYPRAMLRARVISEGVRTIFPGVSNGIYTPEEIEDMPQEVDVSPGAEGQTSQPVEGEVLPASPKSNGTVAKANEGQVKAIRRQLDRTGIQERDVLTQFNIEALEHLPFDEVNTCLSWISSNAP